jgi:hypothetical protein
MGGTYNMPGQVKKCTQNLTWKYLRLKIIRIHMCKWEDNIKMSLQEMGCDHVDLIQLVQNVKQWRTLLNAILRLRVANKGEFLD